MNICKGVTAPFKKFLVFNFFCVCVCPANPLSFLFFFFFFFFCKKTELIFNCPIFLEDYLSNSCILFANVQ